MQTIKFELAGLLKLVTEEPPVGGVRVTLTYHGFIVTAWGKDMAYKLATGMAVGVQVTYEDAKGHPAVVDGDVTWESSNDAIAEVHVDGSDSTIATVEGIGDTLGTAQITASADADLGDGTRSIITVMDVEVVGGEAIAGPISPTNEPTPVAPTQR